MTAPKSIADHLASGSYRPSRHGGRADVVVTQGVPEMPHDLDEVGRRFWAVIVRSRPASTWCPADGPILEMTCRWFSRWRSADAEMNGENSYKAATLAAMCSKNLLACLAKLGCSPIDRTKLRVVGDPDDGTLEELLKVIG